MMFSFLLSACALGFLLADYRARGGDSAEVKLQVVDYARKIILIFL